MVTHCIFIIPIIFRLFAIAEFISIVNMTHDGHAMVGRIHSDAYPHQSDHLVYLQKWMYQSSLYINICHITFFAIYIQF